MKRETIKKILVITLALAMLISAAACGSSPSGTETASGDSPSSQPAGESTPNPTEEASAPDPFGKYDPEITVTMVKTAFAQDVFPDGQSTEDNMFTRQVKEDLGINIEYLWTSANEYYNKLNITIASGDLPDIFKVNSALFKNLVAADALEDLTDVYNTYASDRLRSFADYFPEGQEAAMSNGRLMGLPIMGNGVIGMLCPMWIRGDWLEKSGKDVPTTMDELFELARIFMEQNPGSHGIAVGGGDVGNWPTMANGFHAYAGIWIEADDGSLVYSSIQPEMREMLIVLQGLYQEGIIDKEFSVKDTNRVVEDLVDGRVGITFGAGWLSYWPFVDALIKDPNALWRPYEIPSSDGEQVMYEMGWPVYEYFVAKKGVKNAEAIIKMANLSVRNKDENVYSLEQLANINWQNFPVYATDPASDYRQHENIVAALQSGDPSNLIPEERDGYDVMIDWLENKTPDSYGTYGQQSDQGSYAVLKFALDNDYLMHQQMRGSIPEGYAAIKSTLDTIEDEVFTKIIMGEPIELFDKFVDDWYKAGGEAATAEVNEVYGKK